MSYPNMGLNLGGRKGYTKIGGSWRSFQTIAKGGLLALRQAL